MATILEDISDSSGTMTIAPDPSPSRRIRIRRSRSGVPAPSPAVLLEAFKKAIPRPSGRIELR